MTKKPLLIILSLLFLLPNAYCKDTGNKKRIPYKQLLSRYEGIHTENDYLHRTVDSLLAEVDRQRQLVDSLCDVLNRNDSKLTEIRISDSDYPDSLIVPGNDSVIIESFTTDVSDSILIERLKAMRSMISLPYNPTVKRYMVRYSEKARTQMSRMLGEAKYFFPIYEEILSKYDIPLELKYLSVIESAFKTKARSRAGARGLWQFMYGTAKLYGLNIDSYVDDRMDTWKATDAAARYLKDSYELLGDWSLAIASYNCGTKNVLKAINKAGSSEFWDIYPYLPRETRGYLPAFVGAMYGMEYHKEYGIVPEENPIPDNTALVMIKRKLHFKQLEEVLGIPVGTVEWLNSQYIHDIVPATEEHPYVLRLPENCINLLENVEPDSLYNHRAEELFSKAVNVGKDTGSRRGSSSGYHTVRKGENLSLIAARYGVSVSSLKKANGLKSDIIGVGKRLRIPR